MTTRYDLEILIRTKKEGNGVKEADKEVEGFGKRLNGTLEVITKSTAAAVAAGATFKKAFDLSREGAELNQLTESFDLLNQNVLKTPDLLNDMRRAAGGTIKDTDLMEGVLKLAAGTTGEYAQTLASISPQLLEIARASNKLNPALGDTSFLYESLTTAAKRQSVPIADNLGLIIKMDQAVKQVHPSLQNLAGSYDELTSQQKFLNELLFQGNTLIDQVGGSVDSQADSWARLEVNVITMTDNFKRFLADGLGPVVAALAGDYDDAAAAADVRGQQQAKTLGELTERLGRVNEAYDLSRTFLGRFTGTQDEARDALETAVVALAAGSGSYEEFTAKAKEAGLTTQEVANVLNLFESDLNGNTEAWYEMAKAAEYAGQADANLVNYIRPVVTAHEDSRTEAEKVADAMAAMGAITEDTSVSWAEYTVGIRNAEAAQKANAEAMKYMTGVVNSARGPIDELFEAQADLTAAQGEWVQASRDSSGEIADIHTELAGDLSDEQKKAYQEILTTVGEGSAEWLATYQALQGDLTDSQRAALIAQQAELQSAHGEVLNVYTGDAKAAEEAQARMDAANAAIVESYKQAALDIALQKISDVYGEDALGAQEAYLATQVALGQMSQAQADALLDVAEKTQRVNDVTAEMMDRYLSDGKLTADEAANIADAVALIESSTYLTNDAIILMADSSTAKFGEVAEGAGSAAGRINDAATEADNLAAKLLGIPREVAPQVSIRVSGLEALQRAKDLMASVGGGAGTGVTLGAAGAIAPELDDETRAAGGDVFPGSAYQVGEYNRPELLSTPGGLFMIPGDRGRVFSNADSRGLLDDRPAAGPSLTIQVQVSGYPERLAEFIGTDTSNRVLEAANQLGFTL
jgi:hypothetical protein